MFLPLQRKYSTRNVTTVKILAKITLAAAPITKTAFIPFYISMKN